VKKVPEFSRYRREIVRVLGENLRGNRWKIAELGVQCGSLSYWILQSFPTARLYGVDSYAEPDPQSAYCQTGDPCALVGDSERREWKRQAEQVLLEFHLRFTLVVKDTKEAVKLFEPDSFDAVIVDADHSFAGVTTDSFAWWPVLKDGGLMLWHDYGGPAHTAGVKPAVNQFCESVGRRPVVEDYLVAWVRK